MSFGEAVFTPDSTQLFQFFASFTYSAKAPFFSPKKLDHQWEEISTGLLYEVFDQTRKHIWLILYQKTMMPNFYKYPGQSFSPKHKFYKYKFTLTAQSAFVDFLHLHPPDLPKQLQTAP